MFVGTVRKKLLFISSLFIAMGILVFILYKPFTNDQSTPQVHVILGEIVNIEESNVVIQDADDSMYRIPINWVEDKKVEKGDVLKINFSGRLLETFPVQIQGIREVSVYVE